MCYTITVENRKGGVGKTTTAINLAVLLAESADATGGRVLLMDLDPQGDAARGLGVETNGRCISQLFQGAKYSDVVLGTGRPGLWLLPATDALKDLKESLLREIGEMQYLFKSNARFASRMGNVDTMESIFEATLGALKNAFRYIVIDCPPTLDSFQKAVHDFADAAVVPVKLDFHGSSETAVHTQNILGDLGAGSRTKILALVPTFVNPRLNLTRAMLLDLSKAYPGLVKNGIPDTVRVAEAPALGQAYVEYQRDSVGAQSYHRLAELVMEQ